MAWSQGVHKVTYSSHPQPDSKNSVHQSRSTSVWLGDMLASRCLSYYTLCVSLLASLLWVCVLQLHSREQTRQEINVISFCFSRVFCCCLFFICIKPFLWFSFWTFWQGHSLAIERGRTRNTERHSSCWIFKFHVFIIGQKITNVFHPAPLLERRLSKVVFCRRGTEVYNCSVLSAAAAFNFELSNIFVRPLSLSLWPQPPSKRWGQGCKDCSCLAYSLVQHTGAQKQV